MNNVEYKESTALPTRYRFLLPIAFLLIVLVALSALTTSQFPFMQTAHATTVSKKPTSVTASVRAGTYQLVTTFLATGEVDTGVLVATVNPDGKSGTINVAIKGLLGIGDWRMVNKNQVVYAFRETAGPVTISVTHVVTGIDHAGVVTSQGFGEVFNAANVRVQYVETTSTLTYLNGVTTPPTLPTPTATQAAH